MFAPIGVRAVDRIAVPHARENVVPFPAAAEPNRAGSEPGRAQCVPRTLAQAHATSNGAVSSTKTTQAVPTPGHDAAGAASSASRPRAGRTADLRPACRSASSSIVLDQLLYANPAFLQWTGHQSLEGLVEAGGLDELFTDADRACRGGRRQVARRWRSASNDKKISVEGELITSLGRASRRLRFVTAARVRRQTGDERLAPRASRTCRGSTPSSTPRPTASSCSTARAHLSANRSARRCSATSARVAGRAFTELLPPKAERGVRLSRRSRPRRRRERAQRRREVIGRARRAA